MMHQMDKTIKAQWTTALRSGEYEQGRASLMGPDGHCCLGVLCEILTVQLDLAVDDFQGHRYFGNCISSLPDAVVHAANISSMGDLNVSVKHNGIVCSSLAQLNDRGMSFSEIADVIDAQL